MERSQILPGNAFTAARSADIRVELPVARLAAGAYLLTLEVGTTAAPVRHAIRFEVE
jgi:hypothetical protein